MDKREEFNKALKAAMKEKNNIAVSTVRLILAALKDRDITARSQGKAEGIEDSEILSMLQSMIKQRNESINTYKDAGREDLAEQEEKEIVVIEQFLPAQLSDDEVREKVKEIIESTGASNIKDMGKVMGQLKGQYAGQVDMGKAGALVKELLA